MKKRSINAFLYNRKLKKLLLMMKLTVLLLLFGLMQVSATVYSQATKFNFQAKNKQIVEVLNEIEENSNFRFFYISEQVDVKRRVNVDARDSKVEDILSEIFEGEGIKYEIREDYLILLRPEKESDNKSVLPVQQNSVSGKVTDSSGLGLPGVTVVIKGTTNGSVTNMDGNFSISNIPEDAVLVFSFVGMKTQEVVVGGKTNLNVAMEEDAIGIDEVVVTSFGIKKTLKQLTYATQEVKGDQLASVGNPNVLGGLQGKVAGVSVTLNSGMPGKAPDIKIRGSRSLTGNNSPLYVVDGMPVSGGDRAADFNPNDIESINILKGPAASALYGLRASNGVVIITTKSGTGNKGVPTVSFDTHYSVDQVGFLPDLQMEFAQGENGVFNPNSIYTWGPRISTMTTYTNQLGEQEEPAVYDNDKAFFKTGSTQNSNLSFSNSGDFGNYLIGFGRSDQKGIVSNSGMERTNVKFNGDFKLLRGLTTSISFNYSDLKVDDFPELGGNANIFRGITETPPSYNLAGKPYARPDDPYYQIFYRVSQNNPYWYINNSWRTDNTKRTFGNILLKYDFNDALSVNYRIGLDHYGSFITNYQELGTATAGRTNPPSGGNVNFDNRFSDQFNSNLFLSYNKLFKDTWALDFIVGNEVYDSRYKSTRVSGANFVVGDWANLANATEISGNNNESKQRVVGFYSNVNLGWKDKVFLNASGRNDIVSNMPSGSRSFFYPSVGLSTILTEILPSTKNILSYGKLRATVAEVGQAGPLFVNGRGFHSNNPGGFTFPYLGLASWTQSSSRVSPNLKPENTKTFEVGGDIRFLNNRIGIDYTFYKSRSDGQIFNIPVAVTTGATTEVRNGGKLDSQGHEIMLTLIPVQTSNFKWEFNTNFSTYTNKVGELYAGTQRATIGGSDIITIVAEVGRPYPAFIGSSYLRDPETSQIVYQSDATKTDYGLPLINTQSEYIGSPKPDFEMNFINNISYKNLSLSFQIDWRQGGQIFSQSLVESMRRGLAGDTRDRETQFIPEGKKGRVAAGEIIIDGDNDITINKDRNYFDKLRQINEAGLTDASFVRFREITLNYDLPAKVLSKTFIRNASVYFTGRNLFLITNAFYDPEVNVTEGAFSSSNSQGIELSQIPQTTSYGVGIRVKF